MSRSGGLGIAVVVAALTLLVPGANATLPGYNGLIAFSAERPAGQAFANIWTMTPDGNDFANLTGGAPNDSIDPAWSPDGTKIAYVSSGPTHEIWLMNADGSNKTRVTSGFTDDRPAWSPDGSKIAFGSTRPSIGEGYVHHVWVMNSDGSNLRQLTDDSTTGNHIGDWPDWSPDGSKIAFDDGFDIYTMSPDGSNVTRLTTDPGHDNRASFSPDGRSIAFTSDRGGIYVMSSTGANQTQLTPPNWGTAFDSVWSPDGTKIAFLSNRQTLDIRIWVMNADGSNPQPVTGDQERDASPSWQRSLTAPPPPPPPPVRCRVPNVVGRKLAKAEQTIRARHCRVGRITRKRSSRARKGRVLSQSPRGGKSLAKGAKVALRVGRGPSSR